MRKQRPRLSHERAVAVFGYLAEFAGAYPSLCETEQRMYRDLARAALVALDDEQKAKGMLLARGVDELVFIACREDAGAYLLRRLRAAGLRVQLTERARLTVGPRELVTLPIAAKVKRWENALRDALLTEGLNEPAVIQGNRQKT